MYNNVLIVQPGRMLTDLAYFVMKHTVHDGDVYVNMCYLVHGRWDGRWLTGFRKAPCLAGAVWVLAKLGKHTTRFRHCSQQR